MIMGIGIDAIAVSRFVHWRHFSQKQLKRIFSEEEIAYCLASQANSAERFAARFAAREAFFKALCSATPNHGISFLTVCRAITIARCKGVPTCLIDWDTLALRSERCRGINLHAHISLTHTNIDALACIILCARAK